MVILSPAYGKIIHKAEYSNQYHIAIFLSVFDNHVQYSPVKGIIKNLKYKEGQFNVAQFFEKSNHNERLDTTIFNDKIGLIMVRQLAGLIARTIKTYVKIDQRVIQSQPIGKILFGSRVDLFLPKIVRLNPDFGVGNKVYGGKSILANV